MKKTILILIALFFLLAGGWFFAKPKVANIMRKNAQNMAASIDPAYALIQTQIESDTCPFMPCITLRNTHVSVLNIPLNAGDILVSLRPTYPLSFHLQTLTPAQLTFTATTHGETLTVPYAAATLGTFNATLNGAFDMQSGKLNAAVSTVNLARFLIPLLPQNIQFMAQLFLSNAPQTMSLYDENGWIMLQGFPLFPINPT